MRLIPESTRQLAGRAVDPFARALARRRVAPALVATIGLVSAAGAAVAFGAGRTRLGGALTLAAAILQLAGERSALLADGAPGSAGLLHDTLGRLAEAVALGGVVVYFATRGTPGGGVTLGVVAAVAALATTQLAAYTEARALELGVDPEAVIVGRGERLALLALVPLALGAGTGGWVLAGACAALALLNAVAAAQHVARAGRSVPGGPPRPPRQHDTLPRRVQPERTGR